MEIGKRYKIESDSLNVTVFKKTIPRNTKKENWKAIGYFANVKNALMFLVDLGVNETGLKDLRTVVNKQEELYKLIGEL